MKYYLIIPGIKWEKIQGRSQIVLGWLTELELFTEELNTGLHKNMPLPYLN